VRRRRLLLLLVLPLAHYLVDLGLAAAAYLLHDVKLLQVLLPHHYFVEGGHELFKDVSDILRGLGLGSPRELLQLQLKLLVIARGSFSSLSHDYEIVSSISADEGEATLEAAGVFDDFEGREFYYKVVCW